MKKYAILFLAGFLMLATLSALALGGGGSGEPPEDDTVRVTLKPKDEASKIYGWVRITPDKFAVGANRLEPDAFYAVYVVSGDTREAMTEEPARRTFDDGEFKFETRLEEPFGGEWDKVVLYHQPAGENVEEGMVPVLEGSLE